jgi:hypothetical protein
MTQLSLLPAEPPVDPRPEPEPKSADSAETIGEQLEQQGFAVRRPETAPKPRRAEGRRQEPERVTAARRRAEGWFWRDYDDGRLATAAERAMDRRTRWVSKILRRRRPRWQRLSIS